MPDAIDLFGGAGGAAMGMHLLGLTEHGIEWGEQECATREAAGFAVTRGDVSKLDPTGWAGVEGMWASPPCPDWSVAGKGKGRDGKTGWLVDEPIRWAKAIRPRWIAMENVPPVEAVFREQALELQAMGYWTWVGVLSAEEYGIVIACPLHEANPAAGAGFSWSPTSPGTASRVWTPAEAVLLAPSVELSRAYEYALRYAESAWTGLDTTSVSLAWTAAVGLRGIMDGARGATLPERAERLAALLERPDPTILRGEGVDTWMSEATSMFGSMGDTDASIVLWLSDYWAVLSRAKKWSTISTEILRTTIRRILRCIAATLITCTGTGSVGRRGGCGLCTDWAVPQTRRRAHLMASLDHPVGPPAPTHQSYVPGVPAQEVHTWTGTLRPWVSMAEALGWGCTERPFTTLPTAGGSRGGMGDGAGGSGGRATIERERERGAWMVNTGRDWKVGGTRQDAQTIPFTAPAPALTAIAGSQWLLQPGKYVTDKVENRRLYEPDEPAPTIAFGHDSASWCWVRPSTTIAGDPRITAPVHHDNGSQGKAPIDADADADAVRRGEDPGDRPIKLTVQEALALQAMPTNYPLAGSRTAQFRQVGNLVTPFTAASLIGEVLGLDWVSAIDAVTNGR